MRNLHAATESSLYSQQLEEARTETKTQCIQEKKKKKIKKYLKKKKKKMGREAYRMVLYPESGITYTDLHMY